MDKYFSKISNTKNILSWKSKEQSDEMLKSLTINNNSLAPKLEYIDKYMFVKFDGSCLVKQDKSMFNKKVLNIYLVYDLDLNLNNFYPNLENCLFGLAEITKNGDINKYLYNGYGLAFYSKDVFTHPDGSFGYNVIIFGADKPENVLALGK